MYDGHCSVVSLQFRSKEAQMKFQDQTDFFTHVAPAFSPRVLTRIAMWNSASLGEGIFIGEVRLTLGVINLSAGVHNAW